MKIIAIIPARGRSKGITKKNIKLLKGKPLIYYTINTAQKSRYIDKIIVSTEDKEIAEISKKYGVKAMKRPDFLAQDNTPIVPVLQHTINILKKENYTPDIIVLLQPTSPLRKVEDIDKTIKLLLDCNADSAETFCEVEDHPFFVFKIDNKKNAWPINKKNFKKRRQEVSKFYKENGAVFVIKPNILMKKNTLYGKNHKAYIMPRERSFDIDDEVDFKIAELFLSLKNESN